MTHYLNLFVFHLESAWMPQYWFSMVAAIVLGCLLLRVTRRMLIFTLQVLALVLLLWATSAGSAMVGSPGAAWAFQEAGILIMGMLLIRQVGLIFFRLMVPRLGLRPPRILEELLILLAYVGWFLIRLSYAGLDPSSLVTSTAVVTAVVAFAMQDTLGNILSGLALQLDRSIRIGDWVDVDTISGEVVQVQWRHTAVRTLYGELMLIPNSHLMKTRVALTGGLSVPRRLRSITFYCDFQVAPRVIIATLDEALATADLPCVASDPTPACMVSDFSDGLVRYALRYWLTDPSQPGSTDSLIREHIYTLFQRQGWPMAAPVRDMRISRSEPPLSRGSERHEHERRIGLLRGLPLFAPLTDEELDAMAANLIATPYLAGSLIAAQGDVGDRLFILVAGQVDVWLKTSERRERVAILQPGQIMGEMSLMTGEPRRATLMARTDVDCYALGKGGFESLMQQRPELAVSFAELLSQRNRELMAVRDATPVVSATMQNADLLGRIRTLFGLDNHV